MLRMRLGCLNGEAFCRGVGEGGGEGEAERESDEGVMVDVVWMGEDSQASMAQSLDKVAILGDYFPLSHSQQRG